MNRSNPAAWSVLAKLARQRDAMTAALRLLEHCPCGRAECIGARLALAHAEPR